MIKKAIGIIAAVAVVAIMVFTVLGRKSYTSMLSSEADTVEVRAAVEPDSAAVDSVPDSVAAAPAPAPAPAEEKQ